MKICNSSLTSMRKNLGLLIGKATNFFQMKKNISKEKRSMRRRLLKHSSHSTFLQLT